MYFPRLLVQFTGAFFLAYGCAFALFPAGLSMFVTGAVPDTSSGMIDMRATYGGMSIAVGAMLFLLAGKQRTLRFGLLSVALVLLGMAVTRVVGIVLDGNPNTLMFVYLVAEIVPSIIALLLYRGMDDEVL